MDDITFVGSGIASTLTLIEVFGKLLNNPPGTEKLNITIVEKNSEFWLGIPYGSRSSVNALSITCAHDFIYEAERPLFFKWLKDNMDDWSAWYRQHGGITAAQWLEKNISLIQNEDWQTVYIPRFLLGRYLFGKLTALLAAVQEKELVDIKLIQAEAVDIKIVRDNIYEITLENHDKTRSAIIASKVVISVGSSPARSMQENNGDSVVYIQDIYSPSAAANISAVHAALSKTDDKADRNVLIIGSNASSIELLYLLEGIGDVRKRINKMIVISPSGSLPYHISTEAIEKHLTPNLDKLKEGHTYNLEKLVGAASSDIQLAVRDGANVSYIATIINNTLRLLDVLGEAAKKQFIGIYGMRLSNMFRRSGPEYRYAAQALIDSGEVMLLKGKFLNCALCSSGATLNYIDVATGQQQTHPLNFKVIINCSGASNLDDSSSMLINSLIKNINCKINISGKGFEVNDKFEAAPNLYIMGPLLGGNMNKLIHFWHLENAPRLMYLAPYLADILIEP